MDYEKEYGRYKKKVEDQQKEIEKLREEVQGMKQVLEANNAIIAAILAEGASVEDKPLTVARVTINEALSCGYQVKSRYDEESGCYEMWYAKPENTDGGGDNG